jgi:pimeloyl-ACP methyl ester carboxylesterase
MLVRFDTTNIQNTITYLLLYFLLVVVAALTGCQTANIELPVAKYNQDFEQTYYPIEFTSFDGTKLRATVFQPKLAAQQTAPVIIQLHAFAMSRVKYPKSLIGRWLFSGETAVELWESGYWVVSLDLRGHGDSEGMINLADPEQEIQDIKILIDWIGENLPRVSQKNHDPMIGIIGDSYGAGVALLSSTQDKRIDSIVSANGWYDLNEGLAPNHIPKIGWLITPLFTGHFFNPGRMSGFFDAFYQDALDNKIQHQYDQALQQRSLRYWCDANHLPQADALILQGTRDILFDFNQGIGISQCLKKASKQSRLIGIQDGHLQPFLQWGGSNTFYHVENTVYCGHPSPINTQVAVKNWFDYTLRGDQSAGTRVPDLCMSTSPTDGVALSSIPMGGKQISLGLPMDSHAYQSSFTPKALVSYIGKLRSGPTQPLIFPLDDIHGNMRMVGTPQLRIKNFNAPNEEMNLFIGLGIIEKNKLSIINDQVTAIKASALSNASSIALKTLAFELKPQQQLVFVIYAYQHRTGLGGNWWQAMAIQGEVSIPFYQTEKLQP